MYFKQKIGKNGEEMAKQYLINKEYKIIQTNFRCYFGEIDIIAQKDNSLIFVEVKARTNQKYGLPAQSITQQKKKHIRKTIEYYLLCKKIRNVLIQIDVIEIYLEKGEINHIKNISL